MDVLAVDHPHLLCAGQLEQPVIAGMVASASSGSWGNPLEQPHGSGPLVHAVPAGIRRACRLLSNHGWSWACVLRHLLVTARSGSGWRAGHSGGGRWGCWRKPGRSPRLAWSLDALGPARWTCPSASTPCGPRSSEAWACWRTPSRRCWRPRRSVLVDGWTTPTRPSRPHQEPAAQAWFGVVMARVIPDHPQVGQQL